MENAAKFSNAVKKSNRCCGTDGRGNAFSLIISDKPSAVNWIIQQVGWERPVISIRCRAFHSVCSHFRELPNSGCSLGIILYFLY